MGNLSGMELLIILVLALLVLGPDKLPEAARKIGGFMRDVRRYSTGIRAELRDAINEPVNSFKSTLAEGSAPPGATLPETATGAPSPEPTDTVAAAATDTQAATDADAAAATAPAPEAPGPEPSPAPSPALPPAPAPAAPDAFSAGPAPVGMPPGPVAGNGTGAVDPFGSLPTPRPTTPEV